MFTKSLVKKISKCEKITFSKKQIISIHNILSGYSQHTNYNFIKQTCKLMLSNKQSSYNLFDITVDTLKIFFILHFEIEKNGMKIFGDDIDDNYMRINKYGNFFIDKMILYDIDFCNILEFQQLVINKSRGYSERFSYSKMLLENVILLILEYV